MITCPHCELKLSLKDDFKGQRLACPKCKGKFDMAEAEVVEPALTGAKSSSAESSSEANFFADLSAAPKAGKKSAPRSANSPAQTSARPATATKSKSNPMLGVYIGGGIAGAVLLIVMLAVAMSSSGGGSRGSSNVKWGLSEGRRHQIFCDCMKAVDENGAKGDACRKRWQEIASENKIDLDTIGKILDEGFAPNCKWTQPAFSNYDATKKANRVGWIKSRNETGRDPILQH